MPIHMAGAVEPVVAWIRKVSQRNAPGAISAMAFIVSPVRPRVCCILTSVLSAIEIPSYGNNHEHDDLRLTNLFWTLANLIWTLANLIWTLANLIWTLANLIWTLANLI